VNKFISEVTNEDCMEGMARYPDKYFDLAIVDPPYGIHEKLFNGGGFLKNNPQKNRYKEKQWDKKTPDKEYFIELQRVAKNQIIWGGNYFDLKPTRGIIAWVKPQMKNHPNFSQWEMAWTSFNKSAKVVEYNTAFLEDGDTFHPTQKPIKLYKWLLSNYAKQGDKILDTHLGSGSSRIAAYEMGFDFTAFELDAEYFEAQEKRYKAHIAQLKMELV
jgi:site-specific DNA-methyltransferase (adenine-specific)